MNIKSSLCFCLLCLYSMFGLLLSADVLPSCSPTSLLRFQMRLLRRLTLAMSLPSEILLHLMSLWHPSVLSRDRACWSSYMPPLTLLAVGGISPNMKHATSRIITYIFFNKPESTCTYMLFSPRHTCFVLPYLAFPSLCAVFRNLIAYSESGHDCARKMSMLFSQLASRLYDD